MTQYKTVLVTGGAGFIGSNFIRYLFENRPKWQIINLDTLTYAGNPQNLKNIASANEDRYRLVKGDIRDSELIRKLFEQYRFDGVVHFAAESHVDRSIFGPEYFVQTNVLGSFTLLETAYQWWKKEGAAEGFRFLHISTDEVYGSLGATGYFTEETAYKPSSPYSASKAASDHLVNAYFSTFGFPTLITNCSNNFGPYQFPGKLIPLMIMNIVETRSLPVYGDGKNIRDWLFVEDHREGLLTVFEKGNTGETYKIGGNAEWKNIEIVYLLCDILDSRLQRRGVESSRNLIKFVADRPGHDRRYAIDASKIKNELGWKPKYDFEDELSATVDWYLDNMDWVESVRSGEYRNWIQKNYEDRM